MRTCLAVALLLSLPVCAGTIQLTPSNVAAILSGIYSGMQIIENGKESVPIMTARKAGAMAKSPPWHWRKAIAGVTKSTVGKRTN
jgi:hypothetical protein